MKVPLCAVLCCVLLTSCCRVAVGQMFMDCCLEVKNQEVPKHVIVDYTVQISRQGCAIDAMLLETRQRRTLCVPPNQQWVKDVVRHVHKLREHCHKNSYKGRRCFGVRRQ